MTVSAISTTLSVDPNRSCTACPFHQHVPDDNPYGGNGSSKCRASAHRDLGTAYPDIPGWCPLRSGDVVVRLSP